MKFLLPVHASLMHDQLVSVHGGAQANDFFLEKVTAWQRQLGAVDAVLGTWGDVQKKWQALESIFIGSADIRVQLPDDSRRFDIINANFQVTPYEFKDLALPSLQTDDCII